MRLLKLALIPATLALAPAASLAAPATPTGNAPQQIGTGIESTPAYHRGYYRYYDGPYFHPRRYWRRHHYYYGPRCYWSRYWHRTICR